jgi:anti-sigma-K factor RskA
VFATFGNWRFALAAGVAALAIALGLWTGFGPGSTEPIAIVWDQQHQMWSIEATRSRGELHVNAGDNLMLDPARAYELWALPGSGAAPVSLGLMPKTGRSTLQLNDAQRLALSRSKQIAISLEPAHRPDRCCSSPPSPFPVEDVADVRRTSGAHLDLHPGGRASGCGGERR